MAYIVLPDGAGGTYQITEPTRGQFDNNLNGAFQYTLAHFLYKVLEIMGAGLGEFCGSFLVHTLSHLAPELVKTVGPFIDDILANPDLPPGLKKMLQEIKAAKGQGAAAVLGSLGSTAGGAVVGSVMNSLLAPATYWFNHQLHPARTDPDTSYNMLWRGTISNATLRDYLEDQGWHPTIIDAFQEAVRPRATAGDMTRGMWRGKPTEAEFRAELQKRGYNADDINLAMELAKGLPGPGDLITMAVREAWRDDVAAKYGLDHDWPPQFGVEMKKQGYSEEWSKRWWRAHWQLPSVTAAMEMLHRTSMTETDFKELLRYADFPETWRQWLTEIAYTPYTRVDVRRMHQMGILSEADVLQSYKDIGYDDEKAANMTAFTVLYNADEDRAASKAEILKGYRLGVLTRSEAKAAIVGIGYSESSAEYYLDLEDYAREQALVDEEIAIVRDLYVAGTIDKAAATGRLGKLGLTAERMSRLFESWDIRRLARTSRPTPAQLETMYKQQVISQQMYRSEMGYHGYSTDYIAWYVASILVEQEAAARAEEERAAKEAERIRQLEEKTAYQEAKARLDYEIAQERLHYQQIATAVTLYARREEVDELTIRIEEIQRDIAKVESDIAGKQLSLSEAKASLRALQVPPDLTALYDRIDEIQLQITERQAAIADLRVTVATGQAALRAARTPAAFTNLTTIIAQAQTDIAVAQADIAELRVVVAQAQQEIVGLDIPGDVRDLYAVVDAATIDIANEMLAIADLRVLLAGAQIETRWQEPADEVEAAHRLIDTIQIDIRDEQADIAMLKLEIAEIKALVALMMSSEEIEALEEELEASRERIRELEVARARLKLR